SESCYICDAFILSWRSSPRSTSRSPSCPGPHCFSCHRETVATSRQSLVASQQSPAASRKSFVTTHRHSHILRFCQQRTGRRHSSIGAVDCRLLTDDDDWRLTTVTRRDPLDYLGSELESLKQQGLYRQLRILEGEQSHKTTFDQRQVVNLSSNNYLGLTTHPKLRERALDAVRRLGVGSGSVR